MQKEINIKTILLGDDQAEIQNRKNVILPAIDIQAAELLALYQKNISEDESQESKNEPSVIKSRWDEYAAICEIVADLGSRKTNSQARSIANSLDPVWAAELASLEKIITDLRESNENDKLVDDLELTHALLALMRTRINRFVVETVPSEIANLSKVIIENINISTQTMAAAAEQLPTDESRKLAAITGTIKMQIVSSWEKILPLVQARSNAAAIDLYESEGKPKSDALDTYLEERVVASNAKQDAMIVETDEVNSFLITALTVISICGIVFGSLLSWWVISNMNKKLNLTIEVLDSSSQQMKNSATQIDVSSQALASGTTEQASALEETSSALEEMASMTRQNADNSNRTNDITSTTNKLVIDGAAAIKNMTTAMSEISASAVDINKIINTIQDIAFQTNLLAL
jgi:Methyl-accepting chemotaxis protein